MEQNLEALVGCLVADVISALGFPGNTAGFAIQVLLEKRLKAAAEIAIEELKSGQTTPGNLDAESTAAMLFRYLRAAQEGAARINLRLMAKVMAGQRQGPTLTADEFLYHAEILAHLRREEIVLLGACPRYRGDDRSCRQ